MFSFDYISDNELIIKKDLTRLTSRDGVKIIILFLYDFSKENESFPQLLTNEFHRVNYDSNEDIDLWTYYKSENVTEPTLSHHVDAYLRQWVIRDRRGYNAHNTYPYKNMRLLAELFNVDISIKPCIILYNPKYELFMTLGYDSELGPVTQIENAINIIKDKDFNWDKLSEYYRAPFSQLVFDAPRIKDELEKLYEYDTKGFNIESLINEGFNKSFLINYQDTKKAQKRDYSEYISVKDFLYNFQTLTKGNVALRAEMQSNVDRFINHLRFKGRRKIYYPELKQYLDSTSFSFLYYADHISNDEQADETSSRYSLACYCIGKVLENEINMGFVQKIRNKLGIKMSKNYDQWQENYVAVVKVLDRNDYNKYYEVNYNQKNYGKTLRYPDISQTRDLLFDGKLNIRGDNKDIINDYRYELNKLFDADIRNKIKNIFEKRNDATHNFKLLTKNDYVKTKEDFDYLVNKNFFVENWKIKMEMKKLNNR